MPDPWRYWAVTHADLVIMNPMSSSSLDRVIGVLPLPRRARVLDIACGKGELLIRLASRFAVRGTGVDLSPYSVRDAREAARARAPRAALRFVRGDGAAFKPPPGTSFDAACCVGATWVYGGFRGTARALSSMTAEGGLVIIGHPFWRRPPSRAYLQAEKMKRRDFRTRQSDAADARALGLRVVNRRTSTKAEFHHYESSQWSAATRFAKAHPDDPLAGELTARRDRSRRAYQQDGRDCLGWTWWTFQKTPKGNLFIGARP